MLINTNLSLSIAAVLVLQITTANNPIRRLPIINNVVVSNVTPASATVSWKTDIATDALVGWGPPGFATSLFNADSGVLDATGATSHSYTITGLYPNMPYQFFLRSRPVGDDNQTHWAIWNADGCSGTCSFTTLPPPAGSFDYALFINGPHNMIQGYDSYIAVFPMVLRGRASDRSVILTVAGLPAHTSLEWTKRQQWGIGADIPSGNRLTLSAGCGAYFCDWQGSGEELHISTNRGGTTPVGSYTLTITAGGSKAPTHNATWKLNVNAGFFPSGTPHSYPAIPCVNSSSKQMDGTSPCASNWSDTMNTYGQFWCPEDNEFNTGMCSTYPIAGKSSRCIRANDNDNLTPVSVSTSYQAWFYDAGVVFQAFADYQNNYSKWSKCIANYNHVYRDRYVLANNGRLPGYMIFTEGFYLDYLKTGAAKSKTAIEDMYQNAQFNMTPHGEFSQTNSQREAAYRLEADLWASLLDNPSRFGHTASYWLRYDVAHVIGMIEQQCTQNQPYEYFMAGLQAEALIKYYVSTGSTDVRVPIAIKQLTDCIYASGWGKTADDPYAFPYSSSASAYGFSMAGAYGGGSFENLNLLVAPAYAWLYSVTGKSIYRKQGDAIFQYGVTQPISGGVTQTIGWTGNGGKQFSQNYRWSGKYVIWRSRP